MSDFATNLKKLRISRNMNLEELADAVNQRYDTKYSKSTVSRWESGTAPTLESVGNLSKFFGVTVESIIGFNLDDRGVNPIDTYIPILGTVAAGLPIDAEQNIIGYSAVPPMYVKKVKNLFYLRVKGDSMDKEFPDGSDVLVDVDATVTNGSIAVVLVNGNEATVKKIRFEDDRIILFPLSNNPEHNPQIYDPSKVEIKIIGKVVGAFKTY